MNVFKFRVWDTLEKKYFYSDNLFAQSHVLITMNGKAINLQNGSGGNELIPQQWTGLKDKNGNDIYQGDIIQYIERLDEHGDSQVLTGEIMYDNKYGAWSVGQNNNVWNLFSDYGIYNLEVIGNIFKNT